MSLEDCDALELMDRYEFLSEKYVALASELANKLEKFGKYRNELQLLTAEFARRGIKPKNQEELTKFIESEIEKRKPQQDVQAPIKRE